MIKYASPTLLGYLFVVHRNRNSQGTCLHLQRKSPPIGKLERSSPNRRRSFWTTKYFQPVCRLIARDQILAWSSPKLPTRRWTPNAIVNSCSHLNLYCPVLGQYKILFWGFNYPYVVVVQQFSRRMIQLGRGQLEAHL
jgi:hypothetical protein